MRSGDVFGDALHFCAPDVVGEMEYRQEEGSTVKVEIDVLRGDFLDELGSTVILNFAF